MLGIRGSSFTTAQNPAAECKAGFEIWLLKRWYGAPSFRIFQPQSSLMVGALASGLDALSGLGRYDSFTLSCSYPRPIRHQSPTMPS
jgi:hypothetical protein